MFELGVQTGVVHPLGKRFTVLVNAFGSRVYMPNRSDAKVINYAHGYVRCIADITLSSDEGLAEKMDGTHPTDRDRVRRTVPRHSDHAAGL